MTIDKIRGRVADLRALAKTDPEAARIAEGDRYFDVLTAIADRAPNGHELAREALTAADVEFDRG